MLNVPEQSMFMLVLILGFLLGWLFSDHLRKIDEWWKNRKVTK
jgi:hypothetical protein